MKTELKAKLLQHLNQKRADEGFTLIELLVVIIIIGILSAIALPSFLNQANKAKQSEAKTYVGSMNRAQQAYYLEKGEFVGADVKEFGKLGLGIATQTDNYEYKIASGGDDSTDVTNQGIPIQNALKGYLGGVVLGQITETSEATTLAVLCEGQVARGIDGYSDPTGERIQDDPPVCPGNFDNLTKEDNE
ncbi:MAG: prepilin-type N-terminal cleavage/methylation domain-containing protein [Symploca sp. SIO3C6]|uniref:Prepilin-type N-terminal cleavage/methylation domain-containing protein n=1 Tax=Symploca sp. SIO1C4 TaxID=2607765 RepID=A0A6B3N109_9CYAN|nr:prepilin-type N-terminal cleavage/methylation domain-containing protein [Symploca sp. SIO3C6]NER26769.1 prepilin-type N-terminal cleavage/methylation domain-containing protein [Symploca sp. SIO1C4]NET07906.1 prepilin-type N-terminal cleavage/methylation domain-containing protein [Symploca sp. SIO2B6]